MMPVPAIAELILNTLRKISARNGLRNASNRNAVMTSGTEDRYAYHICYLCVAIEKEMGHYNKGRLP